MKMLNYRVFDLHYSYSSTFTPYPDSLKLKYRLSLLHLFHFSWSKCIIIITQNSGFYDDYQTENVVTSSSCDVMGEKITRNCCQ